MEGRSRNTEFNDKPSYFGMDQERVHLIRKTVAEDATEDELRLFLYHCGRTGLDPLARQIYFQKRYNRKRSRFEMTVITGIDGYRLVADRTGQYAGNDDPVFDDEGQPRKATVTVYKMIAGMRCPFTASARWDQYYPGDDAGFMWRKMPHLMLGKCAEALALRKAFPAELSGLYIAEEMDQAKAGQDALDEANEAVSKGGILTETYIGSDEQRRILRKAFAKRNLDNRDQHAVAARMKGHPMSSLGSILDAYLAQKSSGQDSA